jgi:hypothetical protein
MPDGKTQLRLTPLEFLDRLAVLIPPPRVHRHRYYGVLAPNALWRAQVTAMAAGTAAQAPSEADRSLPAGSPVASTEERAAELVHRSYATSPSGRCCWRESTRCFHWSVHPISQTTYALHDWPTEVRITYPPHPLCGRKLRVVGHRREGNKTFWVVEHADASHLRILSQWTDHPVGRVPVPELDPSIRATAQALRELIHWLEHLVAQSALTDAWAHPDPEEGEPNAPATTAVPGAGADLGRAPTRTGKW